MWIIIFFILDKWKYFNGLEVYWPGKLGFGGCKICLNFKTSAATGVIECLVLVNGETEKCMVCETVG